MSIITSFFAVLIRLFRPTNGVHAPAFGWFRELQAELRTTRRARRARRVRRYVEEVPPVAEAIPREPAPIVPAPRKPADDHPRTALSSAVPVVDPSSLEPAAALVRGHYREHERRQAQRRAERDRITLAIFCDIARTAREDKVSEVAR